MIVEGVRRFFRNHGIPPCRVVIAVSGGTDSTALLLAMGELRRDGFEVTAAHVNHHLRGDESSGDENFVRALCSSHGIDLRVVDGALDQGALRARGVEAAAREIRYERLLEIRDATSSRFVATAHQMDDQAETVLMRLRHGSGIHGLRGILPLRDDGFVRPFLGIRRRDIEVFLAEREIAPRHDRSNDDLRFERNRVRALLRAAPGGGRPPGPPSDPDLVPLLASIAGQAQHAWPALEQAIEAAEAAHVLDAAGRIRFISWPEEQWLREMLLRRAIRRLHGEARDVSREDLARLTADAPIARRVTVTKHLELVTDGATLVLQPRPTATAREPFEVRLAPGEPAVLDGCTISIRPLAGTELRALRSQSGGGARVQVIQLPPGAASELTVRSRRAGDRFQPLGLAAPKRLKELLIDRKIAAELRDTIPLLVWNGEIVWIPGVEVSERFKVTSPAGVLYEVRMEVSGAGDDDDAHANVHR